MKKILKLSIPICVTSIISFLSVFINIKIMGNQSSDNLYLLTLFLPFNYWIISLCESLRVPAIAMSAVALRQKNIKLIFPQIGCLFFINLIGVLLPLLMLVLLPNYVEKYLSISNPVDFQKFKLFTSWMLISSYLMSLFYIISAVLNGMEKTTISMVLSLMGILVGAALNGYLGKKLHPDFLSLPVSALISYAILFVIALGILYKLKVIELKGFMKIYSINNLKRVKQLSVPVWVTYFIITVMLLIFNRFLLPYGHNVVSGFGVAYRLQTFILLPAISIGSAMGILFNKEKCPIQNRKILISGMVICAIIYIIISLTTYRESDYFISLIVSDLNLIHSASHYLKIVCPSYVPLSITLCLCIILDQTGYGIQSAFFTASLFLIEILMTIMFLKYWHTEDALYWSIAIGNTFSGLVVIAFISIRRSIQFIPKFITY